VLGLAMDPEPESVVFPRVGSGRGSDSPELMSGLVPQRTDSAATHIHAHDNAMLDCQPSGPPRDVTSMRTRSSRTCSPTLSALRGQERQPR
jgi:hypothetical protein